jgi:hypothetical protein
MYADDQMEIEMWATRSQRNTQEVGLMVLLSIRMQWVGVGTQMQKVRNGDLTPLWGFKRDGYNYLIKNSAHLYQRAQACRKGNIWIEDLVREYLKVPGLGIAKAGFVVQLLTGAAGCLDMHNVARFGLTPDEWSVRKYVDPVKQLQEIDSRIEHYLELIDACGGSEQLWDEWCMHLANKVSTFEDADDVSRRHVTYLTGEQS